MSKIIRGDRIPTTALWVGLVLLGISIGSRWSESGLQKLELESGCAKQDSDSGNFERISKKLGVK